MNSIKYIGLDVHLASISIAVLNAAGKLIMEVTIATEAAALLDFIRGLSGTLHVVLEEGTYAAWLYDLLVPHVAKIVVCDPRQGHPQGEALRELARSYRSLLRDTTRVMNRLKALYRGRGIRCSGTRVYSSRFRSLWLEQLREPGARRRAELLYQQLDALLPLRHQARQAMVAESRRHSAQKILRNIPSLGPVRVALLMALLRTPHRFRGKRQLWTYAGLGLVTRSSADYQVLDGQIARARKPVLILGLNANHNHDLKAIFKAAASSAIARPGPLQEFYTRRLAQGMKPELVRLTLARKIAAITLTLWKKGERFNAQYVKAPAL